MDLSVQRNPVKARHTILRNHDWFPIPFIQKSATPVQHFRCHIPVHRSFGTSRIGIWTVFLCRIQIFQSLINVKSIEVQRFSNNLPLFLCKHRKALPKDCLCIFRNFSEKNGIRPPSNAGCESFLFHRERQFSSSFNAFRIHISRNDNFTGRCHSNNGILTILANDAHCLSVCQIYILRDTHQRFRALFFKRCKNTSV